MRPLWTGSISFGMINIPVKIYSASKEKALKFRMLDKHGHCPISYAKICRSTNQEVPYENIVKGYEYEKGDYVILTDDDFTKASPKKTKTIDIVQFSKFEEVEDKYIEKPYFIEPDSKAQKAYVLLREALKKSKKVGIAKWVMRSKEHLAMIRPEGKALMLIQLRFAEEVRNPKELELPEKKEYSKQELEIAISLINQLEKHFNIKEHHDTYTEDLKKIIDKKAKGKPIKIKGEAPQETTDMRNLMAMLKKSLEQERRKSTKEKSHTRA